MRYIFPMKILRCLVLALLAFHLFGQPQASVRLRPGRDARQPVDEEYTKRILQYTTEPFFNSPLTDYLPASKTVPTPMAVLGDVAGAPGILPYSGEVYRYMRLLEKASPRVRVFSIGKTEEGREMIAVAVAAEGLLAKLDENRARLAKLADPRIIKLDDAEAEKLVDASTPVYYVTGTIHSPETGAPTALMELAYRLAVDESAYVKFIRENVITLITPIVEVDGRDRMVDIYRWHLANPGKQWPPLIYWGHYVAHDNNRDAMGVRLQLTRNILNTFLGWKAQVLHDLHESVPYLYDNTVGDGPYNAWIDPILADEWQMMGWNNVSEMTKFGMPGVFTHGTFDTWSPGYLMFIAAMHNGVSRLYETFGNGGADTEERTLRPEEYARTWYKQNPPLPKTKWSQRNNNNYEQTGVLTALAYFAANNKLFLHNFYLKARRSIEKPGTAGPSAYVFTADDPRPGAQAELLRTLQDQGCEISRATAPFTVLMAVKKVPPKAGQDGDSADSKTEGAEHKPAEKPKPAPRTFPAGSYVVRMDQPYSRIADALLDYQYWAPNDPQKDIYDDTGWTFGELDNVQVARVTDVKVLDAAMHRVEGPVQAAGGIEGDGDVYLINHNADDALITLRYSFPNASWEAAEEPFETAGHKFNRGSFIVRNVAGGELRKACAGLGVQAFAAAAPASVKTHPVRAARIALMHTWLATQGEGWWRLEFDRLKIPYDYISTQTVCAAPSGPGGLRSKYDAIVFAPGVRGNPRTIVSGMPMYGNPLPWKVTPLTPNLGKIDETDDMRPGLGWAGLEHLQEFVRQGGLLITANDTADFAVAFGFTPGVTISAAQKLKVTGSALRSKTVDAASPIAYGYSDNLAIFSSNPPIFNITNMAGGAGDGRRPGSPDERERATGRGTADDPDVAQGRVPADIPEDPHAEKWEALPLIDEQLRRPFNVIPPAARPRVVLRYANVKELLVSGLLDNGAELAQHAAVIDAPYGEGHVVLFSNNPFWRGETGGSHFLVFNAILNFDSLNAGRKLADR
jgi:hypothetical protein